MDPLAAKTLKPLPPLHIVVQGTQDCQGPPDAYKNGTHPRGAAFIANFRSFSHEQVETRNGSEYDVAHIKELFRQIGYEIFDNINDASKEDTVEALCRFREEKIHSEVDSLVVIFMSHGYSDYSEYFLTSDVELMLCEEVYEIFSNDQCPNLVNKPKLFVFQKCRGIREHVVVENQKTDGEPMGQVTVKQASQVNVSPERRLSDIFLCFSTLPGFVSYRYKNSVSPFIYWVCRVFMEHAKNKDINGLINKLNRDMPPEIACELRLLGVSYEFFFNPLGKQEQMRGAEHAELVCRVQDDETASSSSLRKGVMEVDRGAEPCHQDALGENMEAEERQKDGHPPWHESQGAEAVTSEEQEDKSHGSYFVAQCSIGKLSPSSHPHAGVPDYSLGELSPIQKQEGTYRHASSPRGIVLVIINLPGCAKDFTKLRDIFSRLGYRVLPLESGLSHTMFLRKMKEFKEMSHGDLAITIFYGDRFKDGLVLSDGKIISFRNIITLLNERNCPKLAGKPKLFITNTCRYTASVPEGGATEWGAPPSFRATQQPDSWPSSERTLDAADQLPDLSQPIADRDLLLFNVQVEGGRCDEGSLLTAALYDVLLCSASREIMSLLRAVTRTLNILQEGNARGEQYFTEVRSIRLRDELYINLPKSTPRETPTLSPSSSVRILRLDSSYPKRRVTIKEVKEPIEGQDVYRNFSDPRGHALIFSFSQYQVDLPSCLWRKHDAYLLRQLFTKLGYKVHLHEDSSLSKVREVLHEFTTSEELHNTDSVVVSMLGIAHDTNTFYTSDGAELPLSEVYRRFTSTVCPGLVGKPKIFFFHMTFLQEDSTAPSEVEHPDDTLVITLNSRVTPSGQHPTSGFYAFRTTIAEQAHNTHLESLVRKAHAIMHKENEKRNIDSCESFTCLPVAFSKEFYFNPKKYE